MFFTVLLITFDAIIRSKNHSIVINYNMLAFKCNLCDLNRFSHLRKTGDSLRGVKISFLSITLELLMQFYCKRKLRIVKTFHLMPSLLKSVQNFMRKSSYKIFTILLITSTVLNRSRNSSILTY